MEPDGPFVRLWAMMELMTDGVHCVSESFDAFYRRAWPEVYRATAVTIDDADLAREATDEAMTRAYGRWSSVSTMENPVGWVYRVAVNWARSRQRRQRLALIRRVPTLTGAAVDELPDPDLYAAIQRLPGQHKDVVVARYLLDMSEEATAQAFGIPKGTVKSRLSRALETLKEELS